MRKLLRSKKALSPVVAAIILIAVTVAVSIAVAAWMGALTFTFMGYEKLEITTVRWQWAAAGSRYVNVTLKNSGTKDLTVTQIKINYVKIGATYISPSPSFPFKTTDTDKTLKIMYNYNNGTAYDISIVTTSGYEFTDHFVGGTDVD